MQAGALAIVIATLLAIRAHAGGYGCETAYAELMHSQDIHVGLIVGRENHQLWANYLRANPSVQAPSQVGSIEAQEAIVVRYLRRQTAVDMLRASDTGALTWLIADFSEARAVHARIAQSQELGGSEIGAGITNSAADNWDFVAGYDRRIDLANFMAGECR